jgi:hypothetical protein
MEKLRKPNEDPARNAARTAHTVRRHRWNGNCGFSVINGKKIKKGTIVSRRSEPDDNQGQGLHCHYRFLAGAGGRRRRAQG